MFRSKVARRGIPSAPIRSAARCRSPDRGEATTTLTQGGTHTVAAHTHGHGARDELLRPAPGRTPTVGGPPRCARARVGTDHLRGGRARLPDAHKNNPSLSVSPARRVALSVRCLAHHRINASTARHGHGRAAAYQSRRWSIARQPAWSATPAASSRLSARCSSTSATPCHAKGGAGYTPYGQGSPGRSRVSHR